MNGVCPEKHRGMIRKVQAAPARNFGESDPRRFERLQLKRGFHLDADYTLLNPGDVETYKQTQSGYPAVNFFSEVYFNGKQTAALVYRNVFCGRLCANGQWIYLEKQGNQWVRRSGLNI